MCLCRCHELGDPWKISYDVVRPCKKGSTTRVSEDHTSADSSCRQSCIHQDDSRQCIVAQRRHQWWPTNGWCHHQCIGKLWSWISFDAVTEASPASSCTKGRSRQAAWAVLQPLPVQSLEPLQRTQRRQRKGKRVQRKGSIKFVAESVAESWQRINWSSQQASLLWI